MTATRGREESAVTTRTSRSRRRKVYPQIPGLVAPRVRRVLLAAMAIGCMPALASTLAPAASATAPATPPAVTWMKGFSAPGTPTKYNKVGVIKIGPSTAKNVLVLEPGTSAGSAYFVPLAKWTVSKTSGWQVWSVERRENLLEDQSELNLAKEGKATSTQLFDYYLGYLKDPSLTHHFKSIPTASVEFAKQWGMEVAVQDLRVVIDAAKRLGGRVVLGGHSLGGSVVTAYATWDFNGKAGADALAGLVYIDGGSAPSSVSAQQANLTLQALDVPSETPWLAFGGIAAPYAGLFNATGSLGALLFPTSHRWVRRQDYFRLTSCRRSGSPTWDSTDTRSTPRPLLRACWPRKHISVKG